MKKRNIIIISIVTVLVAGMAAVCAVGLRYLYDNKLPNFNREYTLYLYPEMNVEQVLDSLTTGADAKRPGSLRRCFKSENLSAGMKAGKYEIKLSYPAVYVARMLKFGWQQPHKLTLSGTIRSKEKLAAVINRQMLVDSLCIDTLLRSDSFLARYGFNSENVFALFLPDTYQIYWTDSADQIFARFKKEYDAFWTDGRLAKAEKLGLTPMEVSILASIVRGETLKDFEFPIIAGVYLNRLRIGMRLQADPTIAFCFNYEPYRILKKHLEVDSPYNTYKHKGLPPAPINVPSKACIDAVLDPAQHNYLYFCASPAFDGTHNFAAKYSEHLKNARAFQKALNARK